MIFLVFIITMGFSLWAMWRVKANYRKYSQVFSRSGLTGAQVAQQILRSADIMDVDVVAAKSFLGDHYDPLHKRLVLSEENYYGKSVAALGISAHECGHAVQHKIAYAPLHIRMAAVGVTNYANQVVTWLPLIGLMTGFLSTHVGLLIMAIGWGVIMLFNLVTLPVEFDATRRAKLILTKTGVIASGAEEEGMNKVLDAAAWTYIAAFVTSLLYMLYYLLPLLMGNRD